MLVHNFWFRKVCEGDESREAYARNFLNIFKKMTFLILFFLFIIDLILTINVRSYFSKIEKFDFESQFSLVKSTKLSFLNQNWSKSQFFPSDTKKILIAFDFPWAIWVEKTIKSKCQKNQFLRKMSIVTI